MEHSAHLRWLGNLSLDVGTELELWQMQLEEQAHVEEHLGDLVF